jgi:hypothetical protein
MASLTESGKAALDQVNTRINSDINLYDLMNFKTDISSCNATVEILCDIITRGKSSSFKFNNFSPDVPQEARVRFISEKLEHPNLVYVQISPDHHFVVFPVDTGQVVLLQGFQEVYTLVDWMDATNRGTYGKARFIEQLSQLVQEGSNSSTRAALSLFSFNISGSIQRDDRQIRKNVGKEIASYFKNRQPRIKSVMWWPI